MAEQPPGGLERDINRALGALGAKIESLVKHEITAEMRERLVRCAPAALRRRSATYMNGLLLNMLQIMLLGALGLAGLYLWRWSPLTLFLMLVAGIAAGTLVDTLRAMVAGSALQDQIARHNDDAFVWALAGALQREETHIDWGVPTYRGVRTRLLLDWLLGTVAVVLLAYGIGVRTLEHLSQLFQNAELRYAVLAAIAIPLVQSLLAIWSWRDPERSNLDDFAAGARGFTALLLVAIFVFGVHSLEGLGKLMLWVNGVMVALGPIGLLGCWAMNQDSRWLREHLRAKPDVARE